MQSAQLSFESVDLGQVRASFGLGIYVHAWWAIRQRRFIFRCSFEGRLCCNVFMQQMTYTSVILSALET